MNESHRCKIFLVIATGVNFLLNRDDIHSNLVVGVGWRTGIIVFYDGWKGNLIWFQKKSKVRYI